MTLLDFVPSGWAGRDEGEIWGALSDHAGGRQANPIGEGGLSVLHNTLRIRAESVLEPHWSSLLSPPPVATHPAGKARRRPGRTCPAAQVASMPVTHRGNAGVPRRSANCRASNAHDDVVQQAVPHSPDHQFLLRIDSQLVLYAAEGVPDGDRALAPRLGDLGVGRAAGEQR